MSIRSEQTAAYKADQRDTSREELARILDAEGMTQMLDMLAGLAEERSEIEGDKWERVGQLVQECGNRCEHEADRNVGLLED